jgi:hypothetical protein
MPCLRTRGDAILNMATGGMVNATFIFGLVITVSWETTRSSTRNHRFIRSVSAPLTAQTAFNRENLVVPQGCRL